MKVIFKPQGGRYGYGFDYYCSSCTQHLGNSWYDKHLVHPTSYIKFFKKIPINCQHVGETYRLPKHEIEVDNL